jgi:16S rRNA (cytosine1402-N4)-methyltransferase
MAVNDELGALESLLKQLPRLANNDCRIVIISFQSLEDRLVKKYFKDYAIRGRAKILTPKPVISNLYEVSQNPRARSAKLRALEWIVDNST